MYKNNHEEARNSVLKEVTRQMVGPFVENEEIAVAPWDLYHTAMIWPAGSQLDPEETLDELHQDGETLESFMDLANAAQQSAIGFTCYVSSDAAPITVTARWATYHEHKGEEKISWKRVPREAELTISPSSLEPNTNQQVIDQDGVLVCLKTKRIGDCLSVTATLVNAKKKTSLYGEGVLYQAYLAIKSGSFTAAPVLSHLGKDDEYWQHELIYRDNVHYASGHGCAVSWKGDIPEEIGTSWLPVQEVMKASPDIDELKSTSALDMVYLGTEDPESVLAELEILPAAYCDWIEKQEKRVEAIVERFDRKRQDKIRHAAEINLENCRKQSRRMIEGITLLRETPALMQAFQLANRAILKNIELGTLKKGNAFNFAPRWRPFQLAFILLALPSSVDPSHPDRDIMELIWFPTGGGKTEAYLGLTAVLMFNRYLTAASPTQAAGTAVITRYTLRLLTIQQFERAALMICAANLVKASVRKLSKYKDFDIGLFVGGNATPNQLQKAKDLLSSIGDDQQVTTLPIQDCPVCGTKLDISHQKIIDKSLITWCPSEACRHGTEHNPLPVLFVDEQIYDSPPTFLIGTVDKFANMPFTPKMAKLLGRNTGALPLQLIIQDELHLISDALGTVTALYETAIDEIASNNGNPVKIIGSTATIRRAEQQIRKLFNRRSMQFPSPCLDADDSFFYQSDKDNPGRLYVGIHAQGRSPKHTLARLSANCLQAAEYTGADTRDRFHTLVMYFNSLRELGGTLLLLEDDVPRYLEAIKVDPGVGRRTISRFTELTSKLTPAEIPEILSDLQESWPADADSTREPIDAVLATNMISVGVDVSRLGMMIVNGQPKNTSEYIQASSRVGRDAGSSGIVFTLYNWTRPRDRSHYERFQSYHRSFYRHVENSSVTPFASRARDRALHAVLIAMARLTIPELLPNESAVRITEQPIRTKVRELMKVIRRRVSATEQDELCDTEDHLEDILADWLALAKRGSALCWKEDKKSNVPFLLRRPSPEAHQWQMQGSVRDVESPVKISMYIRD
ncbi:helicase [Photobacterium sp. BZF1]|uniref:helicase-related protein n=1 Tax=Photobacterium sp. BZF1 TaxID=1904457 RepID=UPI001653CA52|nr:helicase-related protein [Photobacterium sp. BZF1]MBC7005043.1 helicase [Photobacterium sp. BZF1]